MFKYLFLTIATFIVNSNGIDSKERIKDIASQAGIPLIQIAYSEGKDLYQYEISTIDSIKSRDDFSTVFQAASLSKPLFAYIVMKMVSLGEIDLDEPLTSYADAGRFENSEFASRLTARVVLSHKSGLPNWTLSPSSSEWPSSKITFKFRPDSAFTYSGEAYAYLQRAVENIRGMGLEEIAREEVFEPLGMHSTSYIWLDSYDSLATSGYTREGVNRGAGSFPRANSAYTLRTTANDYMKFLMALREGKFLGEKERDAIFAPVVNAVRYPDRERECDKNIFWGLGIGIEKNGELGNLAFHWGDNGNFKAFFIIAPKSKDQPQKILVYFTNSATGHNIIDKITTHFLGNKEPLSVHDWVLK
jgi:CubicO group peptidase (beta-lactamase class C family)